MSRYVAVIEEDVVVLGTIVEQLGATGAIPFLSLDELLDSGLDQARPTVLVLGPSQANEDTLDRVGGFMRSRRNVGAVLIVDALSAEVLRLALRAGIDDAVPLDRVAAELPNTVDELEYRLESVLASEAPSPAAPPAPAPTSRGRVTTVFAPKGGVGKSVVAINMAAALARDSSRPVVLVDFDLQFGDVAVMLRLQPVHSVAEAAAAGGYLDSVLLRSLLVRHEESGVQVLAAPTQPSMADQFDPASVSRLLEALRELGTHVVIDTAPHLDDVVLQLLSESDDIVYVVGMDVPSVKNAGLGLQAFELLQVPLEKVVLVLNRADSKVHLATRDVERTLRMKVDVALPSDALVPQSVNRGTPALLAYGRSRFSGGVERLAQVIRARAAGDPSGDGGVERFAHLVRGRAGEPVVSEARR